MRGLTSPGVLILCSLLLADATRNACADETPLANSSANQLSIPQTPTGDEFFAEVLATMERRTSISARLRHQSRLSGEKLVGSGHFWQQGSGTQRVSRWEMQTQVAGENASYVQVFDGRYLWTDRHLPSGRQVHRLDVSNLKNRIRTANRTANNFGDREYLLQTSQFRGGLSQMLAELLTRYEFAPPRLTQLNGLAVHALLGQWRAKELATLAPTASPDTPDPSTWPEQLPHHVLVLVGQGNLFPYVLEFRRADDAPLLDALTGLKPTHDPLMRYEIFEVHFADAIDATVFQFNPGSVEWSDETTLVFEKLQPPQAPAPRLAEREPPLPTIPPVPAIARDPSEIR